jgi:hypothetical protein
MTANTTAKPPMLLLRPLLCFLQVPSACLPTSTCGPLCAAGWALLIGESAHDVVMCYHKFMVNFTIGGFGMAKEWQGKLRCCCSLLLQHSSSKDSGG